MNLVLGLDDNPVDEHGRVGFEEHAILMVELIEPSGEVRILPTL